MSAGPVPIPTPETQTFWEGTAIGELRKRGGRYGLQTMCEGGGQANVTIVERL